MDPRGGPAQERLCASALLVAATAGVGTAAALCDARPATAASEYTVIGRQHQQPATD